MNRAGKFMALAGVSAGMALSVCGCGPSGGKTQNQPTTPYQDQPQRSHIAIEMASAENTIPMPDAGKHDAIVVTVARDGAVFLGIDRFWPTDLGLRVRDVLAGRVDKEVYLRSDARASFRSVEDVIDSLSASGIEHLGLLIARKNADPEQRYWGFEDHLTGFELVVPSASTREQHLRALWGSKNATEVQILKVANAVPAYKINRVDVQKAELPSRLAKVYKNRTERAHFVQADDNLDFATVVGVIDLAKGVGADHISLLTPQIPAGR